MRTPRAETRLRRTVLRFLHLAVLTCFALAQPLFDILGKNPEFFAVRNSTSTQIVLFALVVSLALPALLVGVEALVGVLSLRAAELLHVVFVGFLAAVIALHFVAKSGRLTGAGALLLAAALGVGGAVLYWRASAARTFLTVLAPAPLVFLLLFLGSSPVSKLVFVEDAAAKTTVVNSTTPVVELLFDEFPVASLMDRTGHIDARRWPNFAALAESSTWYRNATTVSDHTESAVPAILTGKVPEKVCSRRSPTILRTSSRSSEAATSSRCRRSCTSVLRVSATRRSRARSPARSSRTSGSSTCTSSCRSRTRATCRPSRGRGGTSAARSRRRSLPRQRVGVPGRRSLRAAVASATSRP